jgi:hypothetical protein
MVTASGSFVVTIRGQYNMWWAGLRFIRADSVV